MSTAAKPRGPQPRADLPAWAVALREWRVEAGFSQRRLALLLGHLGTWPVRGWERGIAWPWPLDRVKLDAMGAPPTPPTDERPPKVTQRTCQRCGHEHSCDPGS